MKSLNKQTAKVATPEEEELAEGSEAGHQTVSGKSDNKGTTKKAPKGAAGVIMQAVAKASMKPNTPGKSGKKSTVGPKVPSKPGSKRQSKDFSKSGKKDIPHDAATEPENEEME